MDFSQPSSPASPTALPEEIAKFEAMAAEWWDPYGKFRPLHKLNPARLEFIHDQLCAHFGRDRTADNHLENIQVLDIGCGGGLLCEPLARTGATVMGIDLGLLNIEAAKRHAENQDLNIHYAHASVEQLAESERRFDLVLNMEVIEHVADPEAFLNSSAALVRPGGLMITATLNRTMKAFALAILGAEYVMGWLPRGTHEYEKFLRPHEIKGLLRKAGLAVDGPYGLSYSPLADRWSASTDCSVNYMMVGKKPEK